MKRVRDHSPPSIHGYQNHPTTMQTFQTLLALLHRLSKVDRPEPIGQEWGSLRSTLPKYFSKTTVTRNKHILWSKPYGTYDITSHS